MFPVNNLSVRSGKEFVPYRPDLHKDRQLFIVDNSNHIPYVILPKAALLIKNHENA